MSTGRRASPKEMREFIQALGGKNALEVFENMSMNPNEVLELYTLWLMHRPDGSFGQFLATFSSFQGEGYGRLH